MKKIRCVLCLILFVLASCAVDPPTYFFEYEKLKEEVIHIELVECSNDNPEIVIIEPDSKLYFNINSTVLIKELPNEQLNSFLLDLSTVIFHIENTSVNAPLGYAVLLYTSNQEIMVLSCTTIDRGYGMVARFTAEGEFITHIAQFADAPKFKNILLKYFEVE